MRIAMLAPTFPAASETFIAAKFRGLLERGHDVHVIAWTGMPGDWDLFPELGARDDIRRRVHRWPARRDRRNVVSVGRAVPALLRRPRMASHAWPPRQLLIAATLEKIAPAVVHFEFGHGALGRTYLRELLHCALAVSFRGFDVNYVGLDQPDVYREVWERADAVHLNGNDLWQRAQARGCPPDMPHALIPPAVDTSFFVPPVERECATVGFPTRPARLLSVGRLHWKKGYEYGLAAVRMLVDKEIVVEYRILGDGPGRRMVEESVRDLGLDSEVKIIGTVSREQVREHFRWADIFLHPAVSEGFCNAALEAQAMEIPVVCSDADGLPENVVNNETGFVVPRRDPASMAAALSRLAADGPLRRSFGTAGRQRVERSFRPDDQLEAFERFYEMALQLSRERGGRDHSRSGHDRRGRRAR